LLPKPPAYIARLFDPAKLQVRVDVPLADASKVGVGVRAEVTVEALPGRTLQGEVTRVVNEADLTKNTLQFKVRIIDAPDGLKPEMLARVKFLARGEASASSTGSSTNGGLHLPFVPEALIRRDGVSAFVLIADRAAGVARQRTITVGDQLQDGWVPVTSGLAAGDSIIAEPAGVRDGTRIRIVGETNANYGKAGG
jgi:multidrug efflux pump subunit AcrA (membrane-fusion protein)